MQHDFILLDRSGSMSSMWTEAINSVNGYVKKLAEDNIDTGVTIAVFDTGPDGKLDFRILRDRITPKTMHMINPNEAPPRGSTPLYDAAFKIVGLAEQGNYDKVAMIFMTDGAENSSREVHHTALRAKLDACRAKNWQVIFLGANFDNAYQATILGNAARNTIQTSAVNLAGTMLATASMRASYANTGQAMNYSADFKEAMKSDNKSDATNKAGGAA